MKKTSAFAILYSRNLKQNRCIPEFGSRVKKIYSKIIIMWILLSQKVMYVRMIYFCRGLIANISTILQLKYQYI